jgi:4-amino-4-deoxy-L-arabinose transferase-like glycosyltransferase
MIGPKSKISSPKSQIPGPKHRPPLSICYLVVVILALSFRLAPLDRYVTPDEPAWTYRAIRFADALVARDWAAVPSPGHPGVTTMWLGGLGVAVRRLLSPAESAAHLAWIRRMAWLAPENWEAFHHLAFFLPWGRIAVALATTLGLVALYPLLARLFDRRLALLTVGLLAFDPFLVGHSGLIHTDALLATFILLALVSALNGLREPYRAVWWALSGLFTGLATLTKTPAIIMIPFTLLLQATAHLRQPPARHWSLLIVHCPLFILIAITTYFALDPIIWANPADAFHTISAFAERHIEMAQRPVFFAGQMVYDPGPIFYPVIFLFRVSPVVLVGLVIGLAALRRLPADRRLAFLLLLAFALIFGTLMSLGVKKHDRYLLPVFPPLTLAANLGWSHLKRTDTSKLPYPLLTLQLILALAFLLQPLTYANPLVGGPWVAARVLAVDWGEGVGAAARWLNRLPDADQLTVAADSVPGLASLFVGHTVPLDQTTLADYVVTSSSQPTNQLANQPAHTITLGFTDHATIYTNPAPAEQAAYLAAHVAPDDVIILDADTPLARHYAGPGTLVAITDLPDQVAVANRVVELSAECSHIWLVADPAAAPITAAHLQQSIETIATPASSATVASASIRQYTNRQTPNAKRQPLISIFGNHLILVDALLPAESTNTSFPIFLRWQAAQPTPTNLHVSLYLRDAADRLWDEVGQLALNDVTFPTSAWESNEWADQRLTLKPPKRTPPGIYSVQLTVNDGAGAQLGAWDANNEFQGVRVHLGDVEITLPERPTGAAPCSGQSLTAHPFTVCAPDLPPQATPSGDTLQLRLNWSAAIPPQADYRVRWQLVGAGTVALEHITALSPYPTSQWREGDSFDTIYDLHIEPTMPAGVYDLTFNILDPNDQPLWVKDETLTTVEVLPRDRLFDLPDDIAHLLDLTLGDTIHLRGFDLDRTEVTPDDTLPLILYWQGDGPTDIGYTVFVHLVGPDGRPHGQLDYYPAGGAAPTTSWASGQVIIDELVLPVATDAPTGTYHIAVGMYDAASGSRLPITDASGQPLPDDQSILPVEISVTGGQP